MNWSAWMARWDRQQEGYMGNREERFAVLVDVIAAAAGEEPNVLDLCCGPGSLSARVLDRLPGANVVALDGDPALQLLGKKVYGDAGGRLTWLRHDIADEAWERRAAAHGPFDAIASTTALHWLPASTLVTVYEALWRLLGPGGVFVDGDHLGEPSTRPKLRALQQSLRAAPAAGVEDYAAWWGAYQSEAADDPDLAEAFAERFNDGTGHPEGEAVPGLAVHEAALTHAGFTEVGTVWQRGDDRLLVALRE